MNDQNEIFTQATTNPATPYFLVYVRDSEKDTLVDAVCRDIAPEDTTMIDEGTSEIDGMNIQHVEHLDGISPEWEGENEEGKEHHVSDDSEMGHGKMFRSSGTFHGGG